MMMAKIPLKRVLGVFITIFFVGTLLTIQVFSATTSIVFDDMEHGDPFNNGWFSFGGAVGGGGIGPNSTDLPPKNGGAFSLETGWGSGGVPGFFGGFGRTNLSDLTGSDHFNFWINPDAGQDYTLEINLQDDDNGDDAINDPNDDEFQYNCVVSPSGPCAVSGGGWQLVSIPLAEFFDDNSFLTGGNGVLDPAPTSAGGNGQLINIVIAVIGNSGSDVNFRTDYWVFSEGSLLKTIIDDFESGLPTGTDTDGNVIGFRIFNDPNSSVEISTSTTPPVSVPEAPAGNSILQIDTNVNDGFGFAGVIHSFENPALDTWVPQDWSAYEGMSFWLYGNNTGSILFIDVLDNRNPGSTVDDAERYSIDFIDDFSGWQHFEIPFSDMNRKEVGNGAPNDGFTLTEVHGWAFGVFNAGQPFTNYMDDIALYGVAEVPELLVTFDANAYEVTEGGQALVTVKLTREIGVSADDPTEVSVDYFSEPGTAVPDRDYTDVSGTLTFVAGGPTSQSFSVDTFDNPKHDGNKTVIFRLSNPTDIGLGFVTQSVLTIQDDEPLDPTLLDDFERGANLWRASDTLALTTPEIAPGDPLTLPEQSYFEHVLDVQTPVLVKIAIEGGLCNQGNGVIPLAVLTTDSFDALTIDHTTVMFGEAYETHQDKKTGEAQRHEEDFDSDGDLDLVFHFRFDKTGYDCDAENVTLTGETFDGQMIVSGGYAYFLRDFPLGQDWTKAEALNFWFYGTNSGDEIGVTLKDNRAADPGPSGWSLVWSDEFDDPAGTPPNPAYWSYEIGDGAAVGNIGWGNQELQYYTSSTENSATDGNGNLVITAREATGGEQCYYGDCMYTSARLISLNKAEFAYGRIESRILVPSGEAGLWPAFWSLGTDIGEVGWPQTGEIDFMEYVSRLPNEIFGTIHGPGYSGGQSFGNVYDFGGPVYQQYHTFAVEWEPDLIKWYVDDILYHTAKPENVAPNQWVFNDQVYLLLNLAIGGNFGGALSPDLTFPQEMKVDYVRVYQGPDTAERFEATFVDNFSGWQQVVVPFTDFVRSADQPDGAPDDGLGLTEVWGYGFELPEGGTTGGAMLLDQVRLQLIPPPTSIVVTNLNNSGEGSLRQALADIAEDGTITFDPSLANGVISLAGPLVPPRSVTVDAVDAPGLALDGGGFDRVLIVDPGVTATFANLTIQNGYGFQLAGGVLNNGSLTLNQVTVTGNVMATNAGEFWQGGGGIYSGEGAVLNLINSSITNNQAGWSGGGLYAFFNTTTTITNSTISGNVSNDVGGAIRSLGNMTITDSTFDSNVATGWHGGAFFQTDGDITITNSVITNNIAPDWAPSALFIGQFGGGFVPTLTISNSTILGNQWYACEKFASGTTGNVVSGGNNIFQDDSCNPVPSDVIVSP